MSKASREFFDGKNSGPEIGATEAAMEGVREGKSSFLEGAGKVWDALTPAFELGAEEVSRALFNNGSGYVFHGDTIPHEQSQHALQGEHEKEVDTGHSMSM